MNALPSDDPVRPALRIIHADATPEEIAALVAVLASAGGSPQEARQTPARQWAAPGHRLRAPVAPGPGAWRASARRV